MDEACYDKGLKKRYYLIDSVRGILIAGVVLYHVMFDYAAFFGLPKKIAPYIPWVYLIRTIGCFLFVLISGVSVHFGKKRISRSLLILGSGIAVTAVTSIAVPEMKVVFGVLSFFGAAGIIMIPTERLLRKIKPSIGFFVSLILFFTVFNVFKGYFGWGSIKAELPDYLYKNTFTAILGFPPPWFQSGDYFPIFPWIFAYFSGYFLWSMVKKNEKALAFSEKRVPFFASVGRYTLWIYLAHQPLIYGIMYLIYGMLK